ATEQIGVMKQRVQHDKKHRAERDGSAHPKNFQPSAIVLRGLFRAFKSQDGEERADGNHFENHVARIREPELPLKQKGGVYVMRPNPQDSDEENLNRE